MNYVLCQLFFFIIIVHLTLCTSVALKTLEAALMQEKCISKRLYSSKFNFGSLHSEHGDYLIQLCECSCRIQLTSLPTQWKVSTSIHQHTTSEKSLWLTKDKQTPANDRLMFTYWTKPCTKHTSISLLPWWIMKQKFWLFCSRVPVSIMIKQKIRLS